MRAVEMRVTPRPSFGLHWQLYLVIWAAAGASGIHLENSHVVDMSSMSSMSSKTLDRISAEPSFHMSGPKVKLGEATTARTRVNPDCVGAKMPSCKNGKLDQDACKCKCPWNWMGKSCGNCNAGACKNGAKMDMKHCKCQCIEGFSGTDCGKGSKCLNGSIEKGGACECKNAWSGPTCKDCKAECNNGGQKNKVECKCSCPANRAPPTCSQCKDPGCKNEGVFEDKKDKDGKEKCGCRCKAKSAWSGLRCEKCVDPGCANGGKFNQKECKCECSNKNWSGNKCNTCKLHCSDGKRVDKKACTCVDGGNVNYNPCIVGCRHGTLDKKSCTCKCNEGFKGIFCDKCEIKKCFNDGQLDHKKTCKCKCATPWQGELCKECPIQCGAHGKVKPKCQGCNCDTTPGGKWTGKACDKCEHAPCKNGGVLDEANCECKCAPGYKGVTCDTCYLTQKYCKNGSKLKPQECKCDCLAGKANEGDWSGQLCDTCSHKGCAHGGEVDKDTCRCVCVPLWVGRYCKACSHDFCGPKPSTKGPGNNEVTDKKTDTNCAWVRNTLGCPGGVN